MFPQTLAQGTLPLPESAPNAILALRSQDMSAKDWVLVDKITQGPSLQETVWCGGMESLGTWSPAGLRIKVNQETKNGDLGAIPREVPATSQS